MTTVSDNEARSRYELPLGEEMAFATYRDIPGARIIAHTEVPLALRDQGIGGRLVRGLLDDIARRGLKVVPRCPFVARFIAENPEFADLVAPAARR